MDIALIDAALAAQDASHAALKALATAHDGGLCGYVADHRGKRWGASAETAGFCGRVYLYADDGTLNPLVLVHADRGCTPIAHGDVTLLREYDPECGDTLHVFTTALRDDAPAEAYAAEWRGENEAMAAAEDSGA